MRWQLDAQKVVAGLNATTAVQHPIMEACMCQLFEAIAFQLNQERGEAIMGEVVRCNNLLETKGINYPYTSSIGRPSDAIFKSWLGQDVMKVAEEK